MNLIKPSSCGRVPRFLGMLMAMSQLLTAGPVWGGDLTAQNLAGAKDMVQDRRQQAQREIFVASNGWHSAIFVTLAAIPRDAIPEASDFPEAAFLGFGWGDAAYFPARDPGFVSLLSAAFQPTPSVLHVTGLTTHPRDAFPTDEIIGLTISADGFRNLLAFLNAAFSREGARRATAFAPGLHSFSTFYRATGEFHLFNNCNSWTARGLAAAGLPIEADSILRAEGLMASLREIAK